MSASGKRERHGLRPYYRGCHCEVCVGAYERHLAKNREYDRTGVWPRTAPEDRAERRTVRK